MHSRYLSSLIAGAALVATFGVSSLTESALAWGSLDVKLGPGEEVQAKSGFFGNKKFAAHDRLGDSVEHSRGIFGNKHEEASILGNGASYNRNIFGSKSVSGGDMLGDKFESHRMLFGLGPRVTRADFSGGIGMAEQMIGGGKSNLGYPTLGNMPGESIKGGHILHHPGSTVSSNGNFDQGGRNNNSGGFASGGTTSDGRPMPVDNSSAPNAQNVQNAQNQNVPFTPENP